MRAYKCDFCGKVFEDVELVVDLPSSFYDDCVADINRSRTSDGEKPTTTAKLARKAGRIYLGVGIEGDSRGNFSYEACPACFAKLVKAQAKAKRK